MMYDVIIGATLNEVKRFKKEAFPLYKNWLEVSALSADRLRGIDGIDRFVLLPGFESLSEETQYKVMRTLRNVRRGPLGQVYYEDLTEMVIDNIGRQTE